MGNEPTKKTNPQEDIFTAVMKLKMSSKRFARESRKAEKEKKKNLAKAEKALKQGNEEGAKLYVANAQNNINEAKKYLTMSCKLDAIASKIKSNKNNAEMM